MRQPCTECGRMTDSDPDYCWPGKCAGCSNKGIDKDARISQLEAQLREREIEAAECKRWKARAESAESALAAMEKEGTEWAGAAGRFQAERDALRDQLAAAREELAAEKRIHAKALASNKQLRQELAALKSRSDDAGRIKRAATVIADRIGFSPDNVYDVARAALYATAPSGADGGDGGEGEGTR